MYILRSEPLVGGRLTFCATAAKFQTPARGIQNRFIGFGPLFFEMKGLKAN